MADVLESLKGHINPIFLTYAVKKKINLDLDFSKFSVIVSNSGNNVEIKPKKILGAHEIPEYADYISFGYDKDKKEFYFTTTSQVYCTHEAKSLENPYNSAEVFVRSSSMVFDEKGREQYSSWYSDEIQIHEPEIDLQKLDTLKLLNQTRPHFYRGIMTQTPEHATIPFKECQERLG